MSPKTLHDGKSPDQKLSRFLAWLSLGLGVPQLTRPGLVNRLIGVRDDPQTRTWQRIVGGREVAAWAGILGTQRPAPWLWARVAGDIKDMALLGAAYRTKREHTAKLTAATASVAGITALDLYTAVKTSRRDDRTTEEGGPMRAKAAITVRKPPAEVFVVWENMENLPVFMEHLESVTPAGDRRARWTAQKTDKRDVEWDVEVIALTRHEIIEWRSVEGSDIQTSGIVRFSPAPGMRGTEVHLEMEYDSPGKLRGVIAKLLGQDPTQQVKADLRRFKQLLETGEIARSESTPEGPGARGLMKQRPAQPAEEEEREAVATTGRAS